MRQIAALYIYDNELYTVEGTGKMVKDALENAARYSVSCPDAACSHGPLINSRVAGFNYDMAQGVEYEIDLTRAPGDRVLSLRRNGKPLAPTISSALHSIITARAAAEATKCSEAQRSSGARARISAA